MDGMACGIDADVGTCHEMIADADLSDVEDGKVVVCEEVSADFDVVAVVAEERRFYVEIAFTGLSEDAAKKRLAFFGLVRRQKIVLVDLFLDREPVFGETVHPGLIWKVGQHSFFLVHKSTS